MRARAKEGRDPTCADETLALMLDAAAECSAQNILEIGAGEGLTSIAFLLRTGARVTAIEKDAARAARARENFAAFGVADRVQLIEDDAAAVLPGLSGTFDIIFLDGPKVQYVSYFPHIKRLLSAGGTLFSDDVLLYGWVRGEAPKKRRMLAAHIREYLETLQADGDFRTEIFPFGEGLAVSKKL